MPRELRLVAFSALPAVPLDNPLALVEFPLVPLVFPLALLAALTAFPALCDWSAPALVPLALACESEGLPAFVLLAEPFAFPFRAVLLWEPVLSALPF